MQATGPFEVKLLPQAPAPAIAATNIGRQTLDKQFHGDLDATSLGEMMAFMSGTPGSGAYVALERVDGALHGRRGTFVLQHTGVMNRGVPSLSVTVVPDSGTGELAGLSGAMMIHIDKGRHSYTFEYALA
jgi:hypothetical protein